MNVGDLVWCVHHIYFLPSQGIILEVVKDMDVYYVVLVEGEEYMLTPREVFIKQTEALQYQIEVLRDSIKSSKR